MFAIIEVTEFFKLGVSSVRCNIVEVCNSINYAQKCFNKLCCYKCIVPTNFGGTRWPSWLRHCATNRKVMGLTPNVVIGIFRRYNPSGHTMTLGSTQPLTEMSARNISWG
jgi:hypothetical protein